MTDDKNIKQSDTNIDNKLAFINKTINNTNGIEQLYEVCIKSKHTRIVKSKKMMPTTRGLQEVHADLWDPHDPVFITEKNYIALLLNKFTRKSWILLLRNKDKFFDKFKL